MGSRKKPCPTLGLIPPKAQGWPRVDPAGALGVGSGALVAQAPPKSSDEVSPKLAKSTMLTGSALPWPSVPSNAAHLWPLMASSMLDAPHAPSVELIAAAPTFLSKRLVSPTRFT